MEPITAFAWIVPLWQMLIEMAHVIVSSPVGCWTPREGQEIMPVLLKPTPWTNELRCFPFSTYSNCYWGWPYIFPGLSQISRKTLIWKRVKSGSNERREMARWRQAMKRIHNPCVIEARHLYAGMLDGNCGLNWEDTESNSVEYTHLMLSTAK